MHGLTQQQIDERLTFAAQIAAEAGRRALHLRASGRWQGDTLADVGDQATDGFLQGFLRGRYPDDGLLSEETKDSPERLARRLTWIVDPLDGTREFSTERHDWAVHVALACDGVPVLGAVALPAVQRLMTGCIVDGSLRAQLDGEGGDWPRGFASAVDDDPARPLRLAVSRSHTPDWVQRFADALGAERGAPCELVPCGSVGFKVAMLLFGKADIYVHKKGLKEWDTCAPEVVARAAGFTVCRFDGSAQRYNRPDPRNDEIVVCRPWHKDRVLAKIAAHAPRG
ncbi:MAG: 3'(2'),5'-bisphosphate nucleotidase CysQ [Planctomycetes bacterium]|nr:3'(2'),5'-bisphosphate nucleotidase CysQ [Planctomycetota bacterium]